MEDRCSECAPLHHEVIKRYWRNDRRSLKLLRTHGVLPTQVPCENCKEVCYYREEKHLWRCTRSHFKPKSKKRKKCNFSVSDFRGTFLSNTQLKPWQIVCFVNLWVQKHFDHAVAMKNLSICLKTSIDWRSFCSEVCEYWFENQYAIGGPGVVVEIDETFLVRRKYNRGRKVVQTWLFGGVERETKKFFVLPLTEPYGEKRDRKTLLPIIKKYIQPGSVIYSDGWRAYNTLGQEGFLHESVNHSENFVDPENPKVHTQNIERLWRDVKEWIKKPGIKAKYLMQYLSRYLFIKKYSDTAFHQFWIEAGRLYPPQSNPPSTSDSRIRVPVPACEEDPTDDSDDLQFDFDF